MKLAILTLISFFSLNLWAESTDGTLIFGRGAWQADLHWMKGPVVTDESILRVDWKRADQTPLDAPGAWNVVLWMPSMGHGSQPTLIQRIVDDQGRVVPGAYEVSSMYFFMAGNWEIHISLTIDGQTETQALPLNVSTVSH